MSSIRRVVACGWVLMGVVVATALTAGPVMAAGGDLDPTFGQGGKVESGFGNNARPMAGTLQSDGKLVIVGSVEDFQVANTVFQVVRYRGDGTLDPTFGTGGSTRIAFTDFISVAQALAIQPDGKVVVVGETESANGQLDQFALARLTPSGGLDPTFGTGGKVTTDFFGPPPHPGGVREAARVVLLQPDGKILVGGVASLNPDLPPSTALARYNTNGSLDASFGSGGLVAVRAIGNVNALALLSDGKILALDGSERPTEFDASGTLLPGATPGPIGEVAHTGTSMFQLDGLIPFAGAERGIAENDLDVRVRRFNPSGGSDPGFTSPLFDFGTQDRLADAPQAVCAMANQEIAVAGLSDPSLSTQVFGVALIRSNGSLDDAFGNGGRVTTAFNGSDQVLALVAQPDGKLIAIGQTISPGTGLADIALARYLGASTVAIPDAESAISDEFLELAENPARFGTAQVRFGLNQDDQVNAAVYDISGRLVATLANQAFAAGEHRLTWNGLDTQRGRVSEGVYFVRLAYGRGFVASKSFILMR